MISFIEFVEEEDIYRYTVLYYVKRFYIRISHMVGPTIYIIKIN